MPPLLENKTYCFWCGVFLLKDEITKDHIIPAYMGGTRTEPCCLKCNRERGRLSSLASYHKLKCPDKHFKAWFKSKAKYSHLIQKYKDLIQKKLTDPYKTRCLEEIELIQMRQKPSDIRRDEYELLEITRYGHILSNEEHRCSCGMSLINYFRMSSDTRWKNRRQIACRKNVSTLKIMEKTCEKYNFTSAIPKHLLERIVDWANAHRVGLHAKLVANDRITFLADNKDEAHEIVHAFRNLILWFAESALQPRIPVV